MTFLVQFHPGDRSRQMVTAEQIAEQLKTFADSIAACAFEGPQPAVTVIQEERPVDAGDIPAMHARQRYDTGGPNCGPCQCEICEAERSKSDAD